PTLSSLPYACAVSRCRYPTSSAQPTASAHSRPFGTCQTPRPTSGISLPSSLGQRRQSGRRRAPGMVDEAGADADDVATALGEHLPDRALGDVEEPGEVDSCDGDVLIERVVGERLADEESGVVDQRVDTSEPVECELHR